MSSPANQQRTFLGHPIGLYILFFTEMWERFSYYGMRALLVLYMVNYFKWAQKDASSYYKMYTSAVYVTPILGGYLADRYLGNKLAVIIGAVLMAIGHFLMAFEQTEIFFAALIFLIFGNGFFKPNMSTQVGKLYPPNDGRRDGAYTIFYMGINLGAFLSPIACGWLAENTVGGYHSGFTLAGIGMVVGLIIYLAGQPLIRELPPDTLPAVPANPKAEEKSPPLTEAQAAETPSVFGSLSEIIPGMLFVMCGGLILLTGYLFYTRPGDWFDNLMVGMAGLCLGLIAWVAQQVKGGLRDRVLAILMLGFFVMFFWAAFEQAGNVQNIWADQNTNRFLTREAPTPSVIPEVHEEVKKTDDSAEARAKVGPVEHFLGIFKNMVTLKPRVDTGEERSWSDVLNPIPTTWFQSINALGIFVIAPIFAWMWVKLDKIGKQPTIAMKMFFGLVLVSLSMAIMMGAADQENRVTKAPIAKEGLPAGVALGKDNVLVAAGSAHEPFHAGRLTLDGAKSEFTLVGVLDENERDRLIAASAPASFQELLSKLQKDSATIDGDKIKSVEVVVADVPPGFDMKFAGIKKSILQFKDGKLIAYQKLAEKEMKALKVAAGDPGFRTVVHQMFQDSTKFRVSPMWLFWSYILATLGELCLSPVGLSMVSKLAPAKFATMLMGVWMLTSAFGNFLAGLLGEVWGTIPPMQFFMFAATVVGVAAGVLLALVYLINRTMHGVK